MTILPYIYLPLIPRASHVLAPARQEGKRFKNPFVAPEHLLIAIIKLVDSTANTLLNRMRVDTSKLCSKIENQITGHAESNPSIEGIPYSEETINVMKMAIHEAEAMHHTYAGTEHLLLGIILESQSKASHLLKGLGLQPSRLRQHIYTLLIEPSDGVSLEILNRITAEYLEKHLRSSESGDGNHKI